MPNRNKARSTTKRKGEETDENAVNTPSNRPSATNVNIRPSGNTTNRGSDMTQSANSGRGAENDRLR